MRNNKYDRKISLIIVMFIIFLMLAYRIYDLQINNYQYYQTQVDSSSTTTMPDYAPRGNIYDAKGVLLAGSKPSYMLEFIETADNSASFYNSISTVYKILDAANEKQQDDFELKVDPLSFQFNSDDATIRSNMEINFKRTRGMNSVVEKRLYPNLKTKLNSVQKQKVNSELLKATPEETFEYLVKLYKMGDLIQGNGYSKKDISNMTGKEILNVLLKSYNMVQLRRYMAVKDAIFIQGASKPVIIATNISTDTHFIIEQRLSEMPGIQVVMQPVRYYPYNELGSAFLGYISRIGADNSDNYKEKGYDVNTDYVGMAGIESAFEDRLKGSKGETVVKLNSQGSITEQLGSKDPYPGENIQLTIDKDVQSAAENALDAIMENLQQSPNQASDTYTANANRGAAVAVDVNTGKVLALVSRPGFNPNYFTQSGGLTTEIQKAYFAPDYSKFGLDFITRYGLAYKNNMSTEEVLDKYFPINSSTNVRTDVIDVYPKPLYNYATMSLIPPGSTFKPMTAVAGLESGVITPSTQVYDTGVFDDGRKAVIPFPSDGSNGWVNLKSALGKSSNPYFMTVGEKLRDTFGEDKLAEYAWKFGLGVKPGSNAKASTGIELYENFGQVYNSVSNKKSVQTNYLYTTMDKLLAGYCEPSGSYFKKIELHTKDFDNDEVAKLKKQIKDQIKQTILTGNRDKDYNTYVSLLTQLINADSYYKDKDVNKTDIILAAKEIIKVAVDDANFQLKIGTNMYNASIGQGSDAFTPLQLVNYIATSVNGGTRYNLSIIDKITDADGKVIKEFQPVVAEKTGISASTVSAIEEGMQEVTKDDGTAAGKFNGFPIATAGKTGSATISLDQEKEGRTSYAVYVGYAPVDNPKIAVCIVVFDGGHGSFIAPVARAMYEAYFKDQLISENYTPPADETYMQDMFKKN